MARLVMPENALNGGFPEPPSTAPVRVVAAHHDACGADTRVRLPGAVPARAVRRFHCAGCAAAFTARHVEEIELRLAEIEPAPAPEPTPAPVVQAAPVIAPKPKRRSGTPSRPKPVAKVTPTPKPKRDRPKLTMPSMPKVALPKFDPQNPAWRMASIIVAGLVVLVVLLLLRGGDEPQPGALPAAPTAAGAAADVKGGDGEAKNEKATKASKGTKFVSESSFSLALPAGWQRVDPPAGATFAAVATGGGADATLWITQDPKLDFPTFVSQSLEQLKTLAGSAQVIERTPAPTAEGTVVRLAADAPAGQPSYEVTLRVAGPYRYYLATTVQPDAPTEVVDGVDLITGSFTPELGG